MTATDQEIEAAKTLSEFCKTAPGRLPERITNAMAVIDSVKHISQQSQSVNERLLNVLTEIIDAFDAPADVFGSDLAKEIREAIAAAEAEIAERNLPVTVEWLKEQPGWETKHPSLVPSFVHKELDAQVNFWPKNGPILLFGATQINDPKRWHVLDLMQALGGATQ